MKEKEELRKKFYKWYENVELPDGNWHDATFDFFYSEIEAREKSIKIIAKELNRLEALVVAADGIVRQYELADDSQIELCIKAYKELRNPLSATIVINDSNRDTYKVSNTLPPNSEDKGVGEKEEPDNPVIKLGQMFTVEGKVYVFSKPEATHKATTTHGHILHEINFI